MQDGKMKIGIVVSEFNPKITKKMLSVALKEAKNLGLIVFEVVTVSGAFEIPFAAKQLLKKKEIDGVATLGAIIKGGTDHDQVIAHAVAKKLLDLSLEFDKPVSLGISGPNITKKQAFARAKEYGNRSVQAVVALLESKHNKKPKKYFG